MKKKNKFRDKWQLFLDSFRLKSSFLYISLYDLLFYLIAVPLFILFPLMLNKRLEGIDPDILSRISSADLTSVTATQTQELELAVKSMQSFFTFFILGVILLFIVSLLVFTLSRTLIWNHLFKKKFDWKNYLKFNAVNIILSAAILIIVFISLRLRTLILMPLVSVSVLFAFIVSSLLFLLTFMAFNYIINLVYLNYTQKPKIFGSIKETYKLIKNKFSDIYPSYLFIVFASIIISFISQLFWLIPFAVQRYLNLALVILFAAWMRIYIKRVVYGK